MFPPTAKTVGFHNAIIMTYNIRLSNGETKEVENVTDITLDKDGMCKVSVEGIDSAYLIFPKSKIELIELIEV